MKKLIEKYKRECDCSCSEAILRSADEYYKLNLSEQCFKMVAPFSGGMLIGDTCGILTAGMTVLGIVFTGKCAHQTPMLREVTADFIDQFNKLNGTDNCLILKDKYAIKGIGCLNLIISGAELLEQIITKYKNYANIKTP